MRFHDWEWHKSSNLDELLWGLWKTYKNMKAKSYVNFCEIIHFLNDSMKDNCEWYCSQISTILEYCERQTWNERQWCHKPTVDLFSYIPPPALSRGINLYQSSLNCNYKCNGACWKGNFICFRFSSETDTTFTDFWHEPAFSLIDSWSAISPIVRRRRSTYPAGISTRCAPPSRYGPPSRRPGIWDTRLPVSACDTLRPRSISGRSGINDNFLPPSPGPGICELLLRNLG